jgi:L-alanine-DL-glutamate epimerase-like enolase superfamily enzyme
MINAAVTIERWAMKDVFATSRDAITEIPVLLLVLTNPAGLRGRAEAAGVDYEGETPQSMASDIAAIAAGLHDGITRAEAARLLPPGGARNALDCALWDLEAKRSGVPAWRSAGLAGLAPVTTCLTIGLGNEGDTRRKAREAGGYELLKLKLDAERHVDLVRIVREEQPRARLLVDANQAWSRPLLERLLPPLARLGVELIEQPVPRQEDATLDGLVSSLPLAADESCVDRASLPGLLGRYRYLNIKLDKCGGLTEALALAAEATRLGFGLMVGNMCGTSLAMAPAFLIAQSCRYVDLDGPLLQRDDRAPAIVYRRGLMSVPDAALWG